MAFTASLRVERREVWSAVAPLVTTQTDVGVPKWRYNGRSVGLAGAKIPYGFLRLPMTATYRCGVRAEQIAEEFPVVSMDSDALDAVRLLATRRLPGLVVTDQAGTPVTILPASQVVRLLVPAYVQEDPSLAGVLSESIADRIADKLGGKSVAAVLPKPPPDMATVKSDDTIIEVAAIMARNRSPLVAVMGAKGIIGVITAPRLLEVALGSH
jgi:predicted transcriptional regulator